jgi:hypothetical protein
MSRTSQRSQDYHYFADLQIFGIDIIFNDLNNYQNLIESFLQKEKESLEKEFNATDLELESKKAGENHREYYSHLIDSYSERHHDIAGLFPHHFRCFFITQTMSVIEAELKKICNYHGSRSQQKFKVDDMKGSSDLERCKFYITHISGIQFRDFQIEWDFILNCKLLRNKIVHEEAKVKRENKELLKFINIHPSLAHDENFDEGNPISFTIENNTLAKDLLKHGKDFLLKLVEKLKDETSTQS